MDNLVKVSIAQDHEDNWYVLLFDLVDQFVDDVSVTPVGRNKNIVNRYNECLLTLGYNSLELWTSLPVCNDKGGVLDADIDKIEQVEIVFCPMGGMYIIPVSMYDEFKKDSLLYPDLINPFITEDHLYSKWRIYSVPGNVLQLPYVSFFTPPLANINAIKALVRPFVQAKIVDKEDDTYVVPLEFLDIFTSNCEALPEKDFRSKWKPLRLLKENGENALILYSYRTKRTVKKYRPQRIEYITFSDQLERFVFERTLKEEYFIPEVLQDKFKKHGFYVDDFKPSFFNKFSDYKIDCFDNDDFTTESEHPFYIRLPEITAVNQQKNI